MGSAPPAGVEMDIIIEETCTVKEVKRSLSCQTFKKELMICVFICLFSFFLVSKFNTGHGKTGW